MDLTFLEVLVPMLLEGLKITVLISVVGIAFGTMIGSVCGYALQVENKIVKTVAGTYIWIIRATPLMVQAIYAYYVIPKLLGQDWPSIAVGILVIALNSGAFISEIVRGALDGIDSGQKEAAASLGMSNMQTMVHIIIPPAFKAAMPALFNQFIISVKDTALLSVIVVNEMTHQAMNYVSITFSYVPTYTVLALFYLIFLSILIIIQKQIEKKMSN